MEKELLKSCRGCVYNVEEEGGIVCVKGYSRWRRSC